MEEKRFVDEVRAFLIPYRTMNQYLCITDHAALKRFYEALGARNWLALSWPKRCGGLQLPPIYEFILWNEMAYARVARPPMAAGVVAKTIMRFGDEDQMQRWLEPIRKGLLKFSVGYSESEAGSDLASLRCRARRQGDVYVVDGVKLWSSSAHVSDYLWLLCRTGDQASLRNGLTLLIVDLHAVGVQISQIPRMSGELSTEIVLDQVQVPVTQRIGKENQAWAMMSASLADERHVQFPPKRVLRDFEDVVAWATERGLHLDPVIYARLTELAVDVLECQAQALRLLDTVSRGEAGIVEAAASKLTHTETIQAIARAAMDFASPEGVVTGSRIEELWRQTLEESIGGGTSEIMMSMVARRALGLKA